jgi:hypothetical protein
MTLDEMLAMFEKFSNESEYDDFDSIEEKPSKRTDLCAFLVLDRLCPDDLPIICSARHDEIWLETGLEELAKVATEDDVRLLVACGVRVDGSDSLAMFV